MKGDPLCGLPQHSKMYVLALKSRCTSVIANMISALFWLAVGAFIGWNLPQPEFAKRVQAYIDEKLNFFK